MIHNCIAPIVTFILSYNTSPNFLQQLLNLNPKIVVRETDQILISISQSIERYKQIIENDIQQAYKCLHQSGILSILDDDLSELKRHFGSSNIDHEILKEKVKSLNLNELGSLDKIEFIHWYLNGMKLNGRSSGSRHRQNITLEAFVNKLKTLVIWMKEQNSQME